MFKISSTVNPPISAPSNKHLLQISAPPIGLNLKKVPPQLSAPLPYPPFCERVMRQRMYGFHCVVLDLCIVSVCEHVKFGKKLQVLKVSRFKV